MSCKIPLTQGLHAVVDAADYPRAIENGPWSVVFKSGKPYARNSQGLYLHFLVLPSKPGLEVDHRDGDALNNRRMNLRHATHHQNQMNMSRHRDGTSKYKGVFWFRRDSKWAAQICVDGNRKHLGYFSDEESAARAYDESAKRFHGEFAKLNFS